MVHQGYRAVPFTLLFSQVVPINGVDLSWGYGDSRGSAQRRLQFLMGGPSVSLFNTSALFASDAVSSAQPVCIAMLRSLSVLDLILELSQYL